MKPNHLIIRLVLFIVMIFMYNCSLFPQSSIDKSLNKLNHKTVPYLSTEDLDANYSNYTVFDTRDKEEYEVSHLTNAIWIGNKNLNWEGIKTHIQPNKKIALYCSIGVRSEDVGELFLNKNITEVYNLYGGIFKWVNESRVVVNGQNQQTKNIHPYNFFWGRLLTKGNRTKKP